SGLEDFGDAVPRDLLRRRDQPARQALGAQLQHPLGLDLPYHQYLLLPPGARYTQRKEPKKVALITNTVGSEPVHRQERTPALNADAAGAQKTEYSPDHSADARSPLVIDIDATLVTAIARRNRRSRPIRRASASTRY